MYTRIWIQLIDHVSNDHIISIMTSSIPDGNHWRSNGFIIMKLYLLTFNERNYSFSHLFCGSIYIKVIYKVSTTNFTLLTFHRIFVHKTTKPERKLTSYNRYFVEENSILRSRNPPKKFAKVLSLFIIMNKCNSLWRCHT